MDNVPDGLGHESASDGHDVASIPPKETMAWKYPGFAIHLPETGIPLEDIERAALIEALRMSHWVQKDAAVLLSISPRVLNYKIKTLGIEFPPDQQYHRHPQT